MTPVRTTRTSRPRAAHSFAPLWLVLLALFVAPFIAFPPSAKAAPALILPTPAGEAWKIIQGYACGTHNAWDRYSIDLVNTEGSTYGGTIRAAADGTIWSWTPGSGTIILSHGNDFFTMYTHMQSVVTTERGKFIRQGTKIGEAGDRQTVGNPHLHFTAFTSKGGRQPWQSVPLKFIEGYDLPEVGGCNQHYGKTMTGLELQPPQITFKTQLQPDVWYNKDQRIEYEIVFGGNGLNQAWNREPDTTPVYPGATSGYAQLSEAGEGMNTFFVRAWNYEGKQTVASFGRIGYDATPPTLSPAPSDQVGVAGSGVTVKWPAASDKASGVEGYKVYVGGNITGTSDWFTEKPEVTTPPLKAGRYVIRVQALDVAGNASEWVTVGNLVVK
jgi:hypothetical protein